ncbi:DNA photolyase [Roseobacter ponti]|uniref:DNA photolyase n=2 Tax=Roseobacter ponti TaxID=1891787 RepID=A0A858SYX6_9RHOB|nr:DNA photolyase [Roseobacter ponti]
MDAVSTFPPDRTTALERLQAFVPRAGRDYAAGRNFDHGPGRHESVSGLSPYLRCRLITEEEVLRAVLGQHSASAAEKFIQEVYWRTYWKGWLELRPGVWDQYQRALRSRLDEMQTQSGLRDRWEAACKGETDIDCFNAWAQELVTTGYLHNHARMWFASIWIFTLGLPWEPGADFFLRHLLDGDPASNTLGWRWVAGIQTPGKTYLARTSNISKFTEGRFHPKWQLAGEAPARAGPPVPDPLPLPGPVRPDPALRTGLLMHEDDLSPGYAFAGCDAVARAVLAPQTGFTPLTPAPHIAGFRSAASLDAQTRHMPAADDCSDVLRDAEALMIWAQKEGLSQIVTPFAPVGPVADQLRRFAAHEGAPRVVTMMRATDRAAWPLATRGFFAFRKNIPDLLSALT